VHEGEREHRPKKKGKNAMKQPIRNGWLVVILCVGFAVVGCASYYKVTDPTSGKIYYTKDISNVKSGAVKLKDARTGSRVTIQNSEVKKISKEEYKAGLSAPASNPAPAATPAPAPSPAR
jgi:hypothetical protein